MTSWTAAVSKLAKVAVHYLQTANAGLQKSLQQEWQFLQRVVPGIGDKFSGVEQAILDDFLPALFDDKICETNKCHALAGLPVKHAGLALPNHTTLVDSNFEASTLVCSHLIAAFRGVKEFQLEEHESVQRSVQAELAARPKTQLNETLASIPTRLPCDTQIGQFEEDRRQGCGLPPSLQPSMAWNYRCKSSGTNCCSGMQDHQQSSITL
jgi:hypothetical protein